MGTISAFHPPTLHVKSEKRVRVLLAFASTSGKTRQVFALIESEVAKWAHLHVWELGKGTPPSETEFDLLVLGSPTYGSGDWHYRWDDHFEAVFGLTGRNSKIALVILGDKRFHSKTFAGALRVFYKNVHIAAKDNDFSILLPYKTLIIDMYEGRRTWNHDVLYWSHQLVRAEDA